MGTAQGAGKESVMAGKTACPRCKSKEASPGDAFCCACGRSLPKETECFDNLIAGRASYTTSG